MPGLITSTPNNLASSINNSVNTAAQLNNNNNNNANMNTNNNSNSSNNSNVFTTTPPLTNTTPTLSAGSFRPKPIEELLMPSHDKKTPPSTSSLPQQQQQQPQQPQQPQQTMEQKPNMPHAFIDPNVKNAIARFVFQFLAIRRCN